MNVFKVVVEAFSSGKMKNVDLPTSRVDHRRLTVDEIKSFIKEEFGKAKEVCDIKIKEVDSWSDVELEKEIDWVKALDIKEFFKKK